VSIRMIPLGCLHRPRAVRFSGQHVEVVEHLAAFGVPVLLRGSAAGPRPPPFAAPPPGGPPARRAVYLSGLVSRKPLLYLEAAARSDTCVPPQSAYPQFAIGTRYRHGSEGRRHIYPVRQGEAHGDRVPADERMVLQLPARPPSFVPERRIPLTAWSI